MLSLLFKFWRYKVKLEVLRKDWVERVFMGYKLNMYGV